MAIARRRLWAILICLLLQSNKSLSIECYFCNNRDHIECDDILPGQKTYLIKCPRERICTTMKGQYDYNRNRKLLLWRGCEKINGCGQDRGMCCHCGKNGCNSENSCFVDNVVMSKAHDQKNTIQLLPLCIIYNVIVHHLLF